MNKKYLFLIILAIIFIIPYKVDAKNLTINYDVNEHFNYFNEQKNNTPFYRFLLSQGNNLMNYLSQYENIEEHNIILIYKGSDMDDEYGIDDNHYVIVTVGSRWLLNLKINNDSEMFINNSNIGNSTDLLSEYGYFVFDENANYVSSEYKAYQNGGTFEKIINLPSYNVSDFTYFISCFYYSDYNLSWGDINSYNLVVTDIILDEETYLIDDNENYSNFKSWLRRIFTSVNNDTYSVIDTDLEYFKNMKYASNEDTSQSLSLYKILNFYNQSTSLPDSYTSYDIGMSSILLVPKKNPTSTNISVYVSSPGFSRVHMNYFSLQDGVMTYLGKDLQKSLEIQKTNTIGYLPLLDNDSLPTKVYSDYIYWIANNEVFNGISSDAVSLKFDLTIYYDPNVYDISLLTDDGFVYNDEENDFSFTISQSDLTATNTAGSSINIFETDEEAIKESTSILFGEDVAETLNNVSGFADGFRNIVATILSMVTSLFEVLPAEIRSILLFTLIGTTFILIVKIIRG